MKYKVTIAIDARFVPCYACVFMGKDGKDSRSQPISWCLLQSAVTSPEVGCAEYKLKPVSEKGDEK